MSRWSYATSTTMLLVSLSACDVYAALYTWTDDQGTVHLSDVPTSDKEAKRFTVNKGCTLYQHIPGMTYEDLDQFRNRMHRYPDRQPYLREHMKGAYRDLFDDVERTMEACRQGNAEACNCFNNGDKMQTKGMTFAPLETENTTQYKQVPMENGRRTKPPGHVPQPP